MSLSCLLARPLVRPLVGTGITPNHLTTLRLACGFATFALLMVGAPQYTWWAGWLWLLTVFLDTADGELARVGNMATAAGHRYDTRVDFVVNSTFFLAAGMGLRNSMLGNWAIALGIVASASILLASMWSAAIERRGHYRKKAYHGAFGLDLEELLYVLAPMAWLDWLLPVVVGAAICASVLMIVTGWRRWWVPRHSNA